MKPCQVITVALVALFIHAAVYAGNGITIRVVEGEVPEEMKAHIISLPPALPNPIDHPDLSNHPAAAPKQRQGEQPAATSSITKGKDNSGNGEARQAVNKAQQEMRNRQSPERSEASQRRATQAAERITANQPSKLNKPEITEKPVRPEKVERPARPGRLDRPEKPTLPERPERPPKPERPGK